MKAFEKWDGAENRCKKCEVSQSMCNMVNDSMACKAIRKDAWRAALEWALTQTDTGEIDLFPVINPRWLRYELENRTPPEAIKPSRKEGV